MKSDRSSKSKRGSTPSDYRSVDPELCDLRRRLAPPAGQPGSAATPPDPQPPRAEDSSTADFEDAWRNLFAGRTPREVLARIVRGERLGLRERVSRRLGERALLLDGERCHLRALAHVARGSSSYRGTPAFGAWLDRCVDRAIDDLLRGEAVRDGAGQREVDAWTALATPMNLEPARARACCLSFDDRPFEERRAYFELVLLHRSLDEVAERAQVPPTEVAKRARRALLALLAPLGLPQAAAPESSPSRKDPT